MNTKSIFKKYNIRPKKSLGQNFVINKSVIDKVIEAANLKPDDNIVEIGPGLGALTFELSPKSKKVFAIEKDDKIYEILKTKIEKEKIINVEIIHGDILDKKCIEPIIASRAYKVVANIPYYITGPVIRFFLKTKNSPEEIILLIQKEVAQRICATPPKMNFLAVSVQTYAKPEITNYIAGKDFWPRPKVDSAIIRLIPAKISRFAGQEPDFEEMFFKIVKAGFSAPRKMLLGNLSKKLNTPREKIAEIFKKIGINEKARAENLNISDWQKLAENKITED